MGSFGDLPKEAGEAERMQSGVLRDSESYKKQVSEKSVGSRSLEGLGTVGRLGLEGLLLTHVSQLIV